jgi:CheY-like chemotaxis protein
VDDDFFNLEMMKKILKLYRSKYHTLEAHNGQEAITLYEEHWKDIKVILMDCEMPVIDGLEATSRILSKHKQKATFSNRKLRIIGLTGHVGAEYKQRCLKAGMEDVLEKPIKIERLNALLNQN